MPTVSHPPPALPVRLRVHVVPMGYEVDRVVLPALRLKAEKVVILANKRELDTAGNFRTKTLRLLRRRGVECEVEEASIYQLDEALDATLRIFHANRGHDLYVNISAGSKIQALAGLLAAMIVRPEGLDVTVYYAEPTKYREEPPAEPLSSGLRQIIVVPALTLPTPAAEVKLAMQLLSDKEYSKLELALSLASRGHLDPTKLDSRGKPVSERARVGLQTSVDQRVVQPLISLGYAETEKRGRKVHVRLTELGREVARLLTAGLPI